MRESVMLGGMSSGAAPLRVSELISTVVPSPAPSPIPATDQASANANIALIVAIVAALASLIVAVVNHLTTRHRERERWELEEKRETKRWQREQEREQARWERERQERREQWRREDDARLHQDRMRAYEALMKTVEVLVRAIDDIFDNPELSKNSSIMAKWSKSFHDAKSEFDSAKSGIGMVGSPEIVKLAAGVSKAAGDVLVTFFFFSGSKDVVKFHDDIVKCYRNTAQAAKKLQFGVRRELGSEPLEGEVRE